MSPLMPRSNGTNVGFQYAQALHGTWSGLRSGSRGAKSLIQQLTRGGAARVARQAHNLKVIGSNPIPATK